MKRFYYSKDAGFSLIELLVVVSLLGIILVFASINLFSPVSKAKLDTVSADVVSLLRTAQNKAMNTDTQGGAQTSEFGVHFETNKYIFFKGSSFDSNDPSNFEVAAPNGIAITPTLPCPAPPGGCNNIVFQRISGEVAGFDATKSTVCVMENSSGEGVLISTNRLGVINTQDAC